MKIAYLLRNSSTWAAAWLLSIASVSAIHFESSEEQVSLIELYTSEGCSSCPPAELWMTRLQGKPGLWKSFVPVAFHVAYWDYLGWRDPFASQDFSQRQRVLAKAQGARVYTPGFFVNGSEWRGFFEREALSLKTNKKVGVLRAESVGDGLQFNVSFKPNDESTKRYQVFGVLLGHGIESKVKRGENRGRTLEHNYIVLDYHSAKMKSGDTGAKQTLSFEKPDIPHAVQSWGVAFWIVPEGSYEPMQAVGGELIAAALK